MLLCNSQWLTLYNNKTFMSSLIVTQNFIAINSYILIMPIQQNLFCLSMFHYDSASNSPELSLLKFLPLSYHHSHSWPPSWILHLFSQWPSWGPHTFFTAGIRFLVIVYCNAGILPLMVVFTYVLFCLCR